MFQHFIVYIVWNRWGRKFSSFQLIIVISPFCCYMSVNVHRFTGNVENKFRLCGEILTHICLSMIRILESNDWSSIRSLWIQFIGVFISSLSLDERHLGRGREEFPVSTPRVVFFAYLWNICLSTIYYSYFFCYMQNKSYFLFTFSSLRPPPLLDLYSTFFFVNDFFLFSSFVFLFAKSLWNHFLLWYT